MATDTEKLVSGLNEDQLKALEAALAARRAENHPVLVADHAYTEALTDSGEGDLSSQGLKNLIAAVDALVATQGALSTTQLTLILRRVMEHLNS